MIPDKEFKTVVEYAPLISLDLITIYQGKILLGKRLHKPALGYYFTTGGIIKKNETIQKAMRRLAKIELGLELEKEPKFIGVFEHFYDDSIFENISTHYVNLGYMLELSEAAKNLPKEQHSTYKWFELEELLQSDEVHTYVKNYFKKGN